MSDTGPSGLVDDLARALAEARDAEHATGRLRGRINEFHTQIDRAEQDVALGRWYWLRRRMKRGRRRRHHGESGAPLVSVITAVYETDPDHLRACIASVDAQTYPNWEHVLVDDGSIDGRVAEVLADAERSSRRVRVLRHRLNSGIVAASTTALGAARGVYVALLDHDDVLVPDALERLMRGPACADGGDRRPQRQRRPQA